MVCWILPCLHVLPSTSLNFPIISSWTNCTIHGCGTNRLNGCGYRIAKLGTEKDAFLVATSLTGLEVLTSVDEKLNLLMTYFQT
jgi:hypothetical protein